MDILFFLAATIGLTNILIYGEIFSEIRDYLQERLSEKISHLLQCFQCMGFWSGLLCGASIISTNPLTILMCGFAGSFAANLFAKIEEYLEANSFVELPKDDY